MFPNILACSSTLTLQTGAGIGGSTVDRLLFPTNSSIDFDTAENINSTSSSLTILIAFDPKSVG